MGIKHATLTAQPDDGVSDVSANAWNEDHDASDLVLADVPMLAAEIGAPTPLGTAEVGITTTATLTIGRQHVCSGTSADYIVTLPAVAGNAGKFLTVRMAPGLTRWVTLKGNGSELIDGVNARKMWRYECATLYCDGAAWTKVAGRSVPIKTVMQRTTGDGTQAMSVGGWYHVETPSVREDNTAGMAVPAANTSLGLVRVLRDSVYRATAFCGFASVTPTVNMAIGAVNQVTSGVFTPEEPGWSYFRPDASGALYGSASLDKTMAEGTTIGITIYNGDSAARGTSSADSINPHISVLEVPMW